jgi:hypothetical protein
MDCTQAWTISKNQPGTQATHRAILQNLAEIVMSMIKDTFEFEVNLVLIRQAEVV